MHHQKSLVPMLMQNSGNPKLKDRMYVSVGEIFPRLPFMGYGFADIWFHCIFYHYILRAGRHGCSI